MPGHAEPGEHLPGRRAVLVGGVAGLGALAAACGGGPEPAPPAGPAPSGTPPAAALVTPGSARSRSVSWR